MGSLTPSTPYTPDSLHSAKSPYYENDEEQPKRFKIPRFDHDVIKPEPIDYDEYAERGFYKINIKKFQFYKSKIITVFISLFSDKWAEKIINQRQKIWIFYGKGAKELHIFE